MNSNEFKGLSLDDAYTDEITTTTTTPISTNETIKNQLFSSIFQKPKNSTVRNTLLEISSAYLINPLLELWNKATAVTPPSSIPSQNSNQEFPMLEKIKQIDAESSAIVKNYSAATSSSTLNNILNKKMRAKLAFRNAFYKYSNIMSKGDNNNNNNENMSDDEISYSDDGVMVANPLGTSAASNLNGNDNIDFNANFPILVPRIDEANSDDNGDDEDSENENTNAEQAGIFVLEIFGTIVGLAWGTFSQIQNFFVKN